jgi:hypothetical protein
MGSVKQGMSKSSLVSGGNKQHNDSVIQAKMKQIQDIKKQMQNLTKNDTLKPSQLQEKRKELQEQINQLNRDIVQRNREIQKEQQEKRQKEIKEQVSNKNEYNNNNDGSMPTVNMMSGIVSLSNDLKNAEVMMGVKTKLEGQARTERDPEKKAKLQKKVNSLEKILMEKNGEILKKSDKLRENENEQSKEITHVDKSTYNENKSENINENNINSTKEKTNETIKTYELGEDQKVQVKQSKPDVKLDIKI